MKALAVQSLVFNSELKDKFARLEEWKDEAPTGVVLNGIPVKLRKIIADTHLVLIRHVEPDRLHFNDVSDGSNYTLGLSSFTSGRYTLHVWDQEPTPYEIPQVVEPDPIPPNEDIPADAEPELPQSNTFAYSTDVIPETRWNGEGEHGSTTPGHRSES